MTLQWLKHVWHYKGYALFRHDTTRDMYTGMALQGIYTGMTLHGLYTGMALQGIYTGMALQGL